MQLHLNPFFSTVAHFQNPKARFRLVPDPSLGETETNTDDDATNIIFPIQVVKNLHEDFLFKNNINEFQGQTSDGSVNQIRFFHFWAIFYAYSK